MRGPLAGMNVVDCGTWLQAPMAAALLGDLGAQVIKIEERDRGDPMRGIMDALLKYERHVHFESINRNKRGIALDLRKEDGRVIAYKLLERADVFVHNFRPQAAKRLGLDYDTLSRLNPKLVYAQASAWGLKGPDSEKGGFDLAAAARSGLLDLIGDSGVPQRFPGGICDMAGALCYVIGILAALQARERLGVGQMVDTSLFGSTITLAMFPLTYALSYGDAPPRIPRTNARNPLYNFYQCADGEWLYLVMMQAERYWPTFCEATGLEELEKDPRFERLSSMVDHSSELVHILDTVFADRPRSEWMRIFAERDLPYAPLQKALDLINDPQAIANDYVADFDHPIHGREKVVGPPYKFSKSKIPSRRPCPEFGQHTEQVLLELGYAWNDIARLRQEKVI